MTINLEAISVIIRRDRLRRLGLEIEALFEHANRTLRWDDDLVAVSYQNDVDVLLFVRALERLGLSGVRRRQDFAAIGCASGSSGPRWLDVRADEAGWLTQARFIGRRA